MNTISFYPYISYTFFSILCLLSFIIIFLGYKYKASGNILRTILIFIILICIANPIIISENRENIPDTVAVLLDLSPSQNINNRKETAKIIYENIKNQLNKIENLDIRLKTIYGKNGTKIFGPLTSMIGDIPNDRIAGAIIITDGQIQDTPNNLNSYNFKAPIHFLLSGKKEEKDRRLIIESAPRFGIVGEDIEINIKIEDISTNVPNALVSINMNDDSKQSRSIPIGEIIKITLPLDRAGITTLNIEVEPGPEELTLQNNKAVVEINAIRERLKVMLISGEPNMGLRSWRNLLNSDPSVDLIHFTILRPPNKQDLTPVGELSLIPFPTRELFQLNLKDFDLIIFDQYHLRGILPQYYLKNVVEYVVNGGALLDTAGPAYAGDSSLSRTLLQNILPTEPTGKVITQEFVPNITNEGSRHPVTANLKEDEDQSSWGPWYRMVEGLTISGDVLLEGPDNRPLLVLNRIGQGRVAQILSDQSWVWSRSENNKGPQADLLRRLVHWLMKEPELEENELSAKVENDTIVISRNSLIIDNKPVSLISPSNEKLELPLEELGNGKQIGKILSPEEGIWKLSSGGSSISIIVGNYNSSEYLDVITTDKIIKPVKDYTKGSITWVTHEYTPNIKPVTLDKIKNKSKNIQLIKNEKYFIKSLQQTSLTPWYIVLILSIILLFSAWYRESR